jgi:hypothetical protein
MREPVPSVNYLFHICAHLFVYKISEIKVLQTVRTIHGFSTAEMIP